jgi:hypothetical protein
MLQWSKKSLLSIVLVCVSSVQGQLLLQGDVESTTNTFSFNVLSHALDSRFSLYVGRTDASTGATDTASTYALAAVQAGFQKFYPLAPEKVYLNGVKDSTNPLIGEKISLLELFQDAPLVVRADAPQNLYWVASGSRSHTIEVLQLENIKDAQGATDVDGSTTAGVLALASAKNYIFAGVKKNGGNFGVAGSGIALIGKSGVTLSQNSAVTGDTGVKAIGIDPTTAQLKITNDLQAIDATTLDMHWDETLERLYVCVKATGDAAAGGARGVLMGRLEAVPRIVDGQTIYEAKLKLVDFVPAGAFAGTDYIVGAQGAGVVADIRKVRTMHTSTGVSYLITVGNSAADGDEDKTVSALPLVNKKVTAVAGDVSWVTDNTHGALADKTVNVGTNLQTTFQISGEVSFFKGRGFQTPATAEADLTNQADVPAQVGAGVAPGQVLDIIVHKDTVIITISANDEEAQTYSSQALFDGDGAIKGWTPWRVVSTKARSATSYISGIEYQPKQGNVYTLEGNSYALSNRVKTTRWDLLTQSSLFGFEFAGSEIGGIHNFIDFPKETAAFTQTAGDRLALLVATSYKKIALLQVGADNGANVFVPHSTLVHDDNLVLTSGAIDTAVTANTKIISVAGGALDTLGAITTAAILNETGANNGGYLVVGGTGGVAVLRANDGTGWPVGDLEKGFANIGTNLSFAIIGSYSNVRKVVADGQFLYVLTNKTFDRIPAGELDGDVTPTVLATPSDLGLTTFDSFSDVLVSSKLALLGTSAGLYRTGNGKNISTEAVAADVDWTKITLSDGPESITRLYPISPSTLEKEVAATGNGGMIYVLASSATQEQSALYRLAVADISGTAIVDTSVRQLPDNQIESVTGPYAYLGNYRTHFFTDGALSITSRPHYIDTPAVFKSFPNRFKAGSYYLPRRENTITLAGDNLAVGQVVRNFASGALYVPTSDTISQLS